MRLRPGSSGPVGPGQAEANPVFRTLSLMLFLATVPLLAGALSSGWGLLWRLAAMAAAGGFLSFAISGAGRDPSRRVHYDGIVVNVEMRRTFMLAATLYAVTMTEFFAHAVVTVEDETVRPVAILCGALCAAPIADLVRATLTRTHLTFDAREMRVRSWSIEASVAWSEVRVVDLDLSIPTRPALRIVTHPSAPSLSVRRRRILLPLEPRTPAGQIVVPALAFDEPWLLCAQLEGLVGLTPDERAQKVDRHTVQFLTGGFGGRRAGNPTGP